MQEIISRRLRDTQIGFAAAHAADILAADLFRQAQTEDFIKFGFEPEFIGRLPVRVVLDKLSVDDLFEILQSSEGSVIRQYRASFHAFGVDVIFSEDGLRAIAEDAALENTGARGLLTVCERVLRSFKYELPSSNIRQFVVTRDLVHDPEGELQRILAEPAYEQQQLHKEFVHEFAQEFERQHRLKLGFTDEAVEEIVRRAHAAGQSVSTYCHQVFQDYQFGLNLIKTNTGQRAFEIPLAAVEHPDKWLSDGVVKSYQRGESSHGGEA